MKKVQKRIANTSPQAKEPVKPTKKRVAKNTVVYPANLGYHGTDKESSLNAEE